MIRRASEPDLAIRESCGFIGGDLGELSLPYELNDEELVEEARKDKERLARKRPCGFQAVWDD